MRLTFTLALLSAVACSSTTSGGDAGIDSGGSDAAARDGGGSDDAGTTSDATGCLPVPVHCLPDCAGVMHPAVCVGGTWTCPIAGCDGGASDAAVTDAGDTFVCSGTVTCTRYTQFCDLSDIPECLTIPATCPMPPTCDCLTGMGHTSCMMDSNGGITTHSPGG